MLLDCKSRSFIFKLVMLMLIIYVVVDIRVLIYATFCFREQSLVVFSGGLPQGNKHRGLTLVRGRSKMLLLSDVVVDFVCLCETPWKQG